MCALYEALYWICFNLSFENASLFYMIFIIIPYKSWQDLKLQESIHAWRKAFKTFKFKFTQVPISFQRYFLMMSFKAYLENWAGEKKGKHWRYSLFDHQRYPSPNYFLRKVFIFWNEVWTQSWTIWRNFCQCLSCLVFHNLSGLCLALLQIKVPINCQMLISVRKIYSVCSLISQCVPMFHLSSQTLV